MTQTIQERKPFLVDQNFVSKKSNCKTKVSHRRYKYYPHSITVSDVLKDLELDVTTTEKIRIAQLASESLRLIYDITPIKSRGKVLYSNKTVSCVYNAIDHVRSN